MRRSALILVLAILTCLPMAREPQPDFAARLIAGGEAALAAGRPALAFQLFQQANAYRAPDADHLERLYDAAIAAHRPDLAAAYLALQAQRDDWNADLLRRSAGDLASPRGDRDLAAAYWAGVLALVPDDVAALRETARTALRQGDWTAGQRALERLSVVAPDDSTALFQLGLLVLPDDRAAGLGYLARAASRYGAQTEQINTLLAGLPDASSAEIAFRLGLACFNFGALPQSEHALIVALRQNTGEDPRALAFLGMVQRAQGRDGSAPVSRALALAANDPVVNYAAGIYYRMVGDDETALGLLKLAQTVDPSNAALAAEIGKTYQSMGFPGETVAWLIQAARLAPADPQFDTLLAVFVADSGYDLAGQGLLMLRELATRRPDSPDIQAALGWALLSVERYDESRRVLEHALTLAPLNARARYYFGVLLESQGDLGGARAAYTFVAQSGGLFQEQAARALARLGG